MAALTYVFAILSRNPSLQVTGCMTWGRLSRWQVAPGGGAIVGGEQLIIDGSAMADGGPADCVQFSTHGAFSVTTGPDGFIYAAFGDGAAFTLVDVGQLGNDPCNSPRRSSSVLIRAV
jgi:hypothetical protein